MTNEDAAAIAQAEEDAERAGEGRTAAPAPRWTAAGAPVDRLWPVAPEDVVLHAAGLAVYLAERQLREEQR